MTGDSPDPGESSLLVCDNGLAHNTIMVITFELTAGTYEMNR